MMGDCVDLCHVDHVDSWISLPFQDPAGTHRWHFFLWTLMAGGKLATQQGSAIAMLRILNNSKLCGVRENRCTNLLLSTDPVGNSLEMEIQQAALWNVWRPWTMGQERTAVQHWPILCHNSALSTRGLKVLQEVFWWICWPSFRQTSLISPPFPLLLPLPSGKLHSLVPLPLLLPFPWPCHFKAQNILMEDVCHSQCTGIKFDVE